MKSKNKAIICILFAAVGFAFMNLFVKLSGDLPAIEKSFFRNLVAIVPATCVMIAKKIPFSIPKAARMPIFLRSFVGSLGIFTNFYAISHLPISDASMLNKLSPFFAILFSYMLMKETIKPYQLMCVIAAFIGALFILRPGADSMTSFPALIGLIGGACAGFAYTNVRRATMAGAAGPVIVLCFSVFSCLFALPLMLPDFVPLTGNQLLCLIMAGVSAACGQFGITAAYRLAPAAEISVYDYSQVIFAAILGAIFLGELPDSFSFIGYIIIIGAGVTMFIMNRKYAK